MVPKFFNSLLKSELRKLSCSRLEKKKGDISGKLKPQEVMFLPPDVRKMPREK